ncbi:MAG: hypothetical protein EOO20_05435 [Chryseobacterium sp.]|nr:MAG: hypothetical protein EOO20_05435 [Chryseobacterium sp.]
MGAHELKQLAKELRPYLVEILREDGYGLYKLDDQRDLMGEELARQAKVESLQRKYLRRKALTIAEILEAELLPARGRTTIVRWIENKKIRPDEVLVSSDGKGTRLILVSAIKRMMPHFK